MKNFCCLKKILIHLIVLCLSSVSYGEDNRLIQAIVEKDIRRTRALLRNFPTLELIMCTDDKGDTPLYIASEEGNIELVQLLLNSIDYVLPKDLAAKRIMQANNDGGTPLYIASYYGHATVVKALLMGVEHS